MEKGRGLREAAAEEKGRGLIEAVRRRAVVISLAAMMCVSVLGFVRCLSTDDIIENWNQNKLKVLKFV